MTKEAKLQINITYDMESKIKEQAKLHGITKNEYVKHCIITCLQNNIKGKVVE